MGCVVDSPEVQALVQQIKGYKKKIIIAAIGVWQKRNNDTDKLPTAEELIELCYDINKAKDINYKNKVEKQVEEGKFNIQSTSISNLDLTTRQKAQAKMYTLIGKEDTNMLVEDLTMLFFDKFLTQDGNGHTWQEYLYQYVLKEDNATNSEHKWHIENDADPYLYMIEHFAKDMFDYLKSRMEERWSKYQEGGEYFDFYEGDSDDHIPQIFEAIHDHNDIWQLLCERVATRLGNKLGYKITLHTGIDELVTDEDENNNTIEDLATSGESTVREGWQIKTAEVSNRSSLSRKTKLFLATVSQIGKFDGKWDIDLSKIGYPKMYDGSVLYAMLLKACHTAKTKTEMMQMIEKEAETSLPFKSLWQKLQSKEVSEEMKTALFVAIRKDYVEQYMMTFRTHDVTRIKNLNKEHRYGNTYQLIKENLETGTVLSEYSIYNNNGGYAGVDKIQQYVQSTSTTIYSAVFPNIDKRYSNTVGVNINNLADFKTSEAIDAFFNIFLAMGVPINRDETELAITGIDKTEDMQTLLYALSEILIGPFTQERFIDKDLKEADKHPDDIERPRNTMGAVVSIQAKLYGDVAKYLNINNDSLVELSVFINGIGTYYSMRNPSYETTLFQRLRDAYMATKRNEKGDTAISKLIKELYGDTFWYTYTGKDDETHYWGWLNDMLKGASTTGIQESKVVDPLLTIRDYPCIEIDGKKIKYEDMTIQDFYNWMWQGFMENNTYAQYPLPIRSNLPSLRGIMFEKYDIEELIPRLRDLVKQERARIILVKLRDQERQQGKSIPIIEHFDIKRDSQGRIIDKGGSEFKFLPLLNSYKTEDNTSLLDAIQECVNEHASVDNLIDTAVESVMDEMLRKEYLKWMELEVLNCDQDLLQRKAETVQYHLDSFKKPNQNSKDSQISQYIKLVEQTIECYKNNTFPELSVYKQIEKIVQNFNKNKKPNRMPSVTPPYRNDNNFFYNMVYAQSQIIQLLNVDLAFADGMTDFQKRFRQVEGAGTVLDTEAKDNDGNRVGKKYETSITLADATYESHQQVAADIAIQSVAEGKMSAFTAATHLATMGWSNYKDKNGKKMVKINNVVVYSKKVKSTDGQSLRTLPSWRAIMKMADNDKWSDGAEKAYQNIIKGTFTENDILVVYNTIKPFAFSLVNRESYIEGFGKIKVPIQHKNSEMLLLSIYQCAGSLYNSNEVVQGINQFLIDNEIDVVHFSSVVKQGAHSIGDINDCKTKQQVINKLNSLKDNMPDFIQTFPYEDYHIQVETPQHFVDEIQGIGTQIRNLIYSDMADDETFTVGGKTLTKKEWLEQYCEIYTENILEKFQQVMGRLMNTEEMVKLLQEEIISNDRYSKDLINALALTKDGKFTVPFFESSQSRRIEEMICSIIRKNVTRQKTKGGTLIQCTSLGFTDQLQIKGKKTKDKDGKVNYTNIEYFECYMPASSKEWLAPLLNDKGELDISKLDKGAEKLLNAIGYRIPTEGMSSAVPLRIKGFLPVQQGDAIMFPAEVLALSGSDFDIDKLYVMLYEFKTLRYDYARAHADFKRKDSNTQLGDALKAALSNSTDEDVQKLLSSENKEDQDFKSWWEENKESYALEPKDYKFRKIEYNEKKGASKNTRQQRNNRLIDLMWGVLTSHSGSQRLLQPQGFHDIQTHSKIITLFTNYTYSDLCTLLEKNNLQSSFSNKQELLNYLKTLDVDVLANLIREVEGQIEPLVPSTLGHFMNENMSALKLTSIYALYNPLHATLCNFNPDFQLFNNFDGLFEYNAQKMSLMKDREGNLISKNIGQFLGASVDNGKDPNLAKLMQNQNTAEIAMLMCYMGYTISDISVFLNQPMIKEYINRVMSKTKWKDKQEADEKLKKKYPFNKDTHKAKPDTSMEQLLKDLLYPQEHQKMLMNNPEQAEDDGIKKELEDYNYRQSYLLRQFITLSLIAEQFKKKVVQGFRFNVEGGALGPTIEASEVHLERAASSYNIQALEASNGCWFKNMPRIQGNYLQYVQEKKEKQAKKEKEQQPESTPKQATQTPVSQNTKVEIDAAMNIEEEPEGTDQKTDTQSSDDYLNSQYQRLICKNSPMNSMEQAYYTMGLEVPLEKIAEKFFSARHSAMTRYIENYIRTITGKTELSEQVRRKLKDEFIQFHVTQIPAFKKEEGIDDKTHQPYIISKKQKRLYWYKVFPKEVQKMIEENEECKNNPFLMRLKNVQLKNTKLHYLEYRSLGKTTTDTEYDHSMAWADLMNSKDDKVRELAVKLLVYTLQTTSGGYGFRGFAHLCPVVVKQALPKYLETLHKLDTVSQQYPYFMSFDKEEHKDIINGLRQYCRQFIQNHLYDNLLNIREVSLNKISKTNRNIYDQIQANHSFTISAKDADIDEHSPLFNLKIVKFGKEQKTTSAKKDYSSHLAYYIYYDKEKEEYHFIYINPLGFRGMLTEYDYTKDGYAWNMKTVFTNPVLFDQDFDPNNEEDMELQKEVQELDKPTLNTNYKVVDLDDYYKYNSDDPSDDAKAQFGSATDVPEAYDQDLVDTSSISTYPANANYTDATGKTVCQ